jgi:hypothetical protein
MSLGQIGTGAPFYFLRAEIFSPSPHALIGTGGLTKFFSKICRRSLIPQGTRAWLRGDPDPEPHNR